MDLAAWLTSTNPLFVDLALFVGRVAIGICFMIHAFGKLGWVGTGNMEGFAAWLGDLGVPMPHIQARMAMLSELVGGAFLAAGFLTRPACLALIGTMVVAGVVGHRGAGYLITNDPPGAEYTINLAVICGMFLLLGPGQISLDAILF